MKKQRQHRDHPPKSRNLKLVLTIERLGSRGEGIARHEGTTVFVQRGVPGDVVNCRIKRSTGNIMEAVIERIVTPSPLRQASGCASFDRGCGGCQWLHIPYEFQCRSKTTIIEDVLQKNGLHSVIVRPVIGMSDPSHARNKLTLIRDKDGRLGMLPEHTSRESADDTVILVDHCRQVMAANMEAYDRLKTLRVPASVMQVHVRAAADGRIGICFFSAAVGREAREFARTVLKSVPSTIGVGVKTYRGYEHLEGSEYLTHVIDGTTYCVHIAGFFQTNYAQAVQLRAQVVDAARPMRNDIVFDLYSGCGFFSFALARKAENIVAMEGNRLSHAAAIDGARINRINNIRFMQGDVLQSLRSSRGFTASSVILDPSRTGTEPHVLDELARIRPQRIVYVSCSPEVLAREASLLTKSGYRLAYCQPVDMFPHTYHVETVALFERIK